MSIELYDHQKKAIKELHSGSVLVGGVGSGKSRTAIAYYFLQECKGIIRDKKPVSICCPKNLYIITTARKRDTLEWDAELVPFLLSTDKKVNMFGVKVVIDSWNNIKKYSDVANAFFIFDEQRVVGSGTWVKSFIRISKRNRWILLSATPGDVWMDYVPIFIANGFYKNRTEFIKKHVIYNRFSKFPKIDKYINTSRLEMCRKKVLVSMPCERKTIRHSKDVFVDYDIDLYNQVSKNRWNIFENAPIKNASEFCYLLRKIVNSDIHRITTILDIYKKHNKLIVFYNFDYELELLRKALNDAKIIYAEWNGHKHESIPSTNSWIYLVQYTAGSEGWNCILTDTIIFFSLNYSYKVMEQAAGRIDRLNTEFTDLYYFYIMSKASIDTGIRKTLKKKQNFNERMFCPNF